VGVHRLRRSRLDEHAHRGCARDDQPASRSSSSRPGTFATRVSAPVLQELELPYAGDVTVNDAFRPLSKFFDEVNRPEQLPSALMGAMRVLTDPAETGAVTISLPQDVQAEAFDWPEGLFDRAHLARAAPPARGLPDRRLAAAVIRSAKRPIDRRRRWGALLRRRGRRSLDFCEATGIPVGEAQAGKGSLPHGHPQQMGAVGSTGTTAANALAHDADVVIGIGTRLGRLHHRPPEPPSRGRVCASSNINVGPFRRRQAQRVCRVRRTPAKPSPRSAELEGWTGAGGIPKRQASPVEGVGRARRGAYHPSAMPSPRRLAEGLLTQGAVLGCVNELTDPRDVVLCAAGSMPGDLHKLWRVRDRKAYHVEYGYSCMGYEVPASLGIKLADQTREVFAMVGDGGYLMMPTELVTAVQERIKVIVVLVQNHGFHSIGSLSESLGSQRFGTATGCAARPRTGSTATSCRSTWRPTPAAWAATSSRCTHARSSRRDRRRPAPGLRTAARSSSTSRPTRSSTPPTATAGGTSP
jgi:3D-(3,5/4)-trihydroxycyclohexane-1,2-dione acylhydrolase (decyclizing)